MGLKESIWWISIEYDVQVIGYPSKLIGLYCKQSIIFRSDSNGEDLEGYAGAGLYDRSDSSYSLTCESTLFCMYSSFSRCHLTIFLWTHCSVVMDKVEKVVLDYSNDRLVVDKAFQNSLFSKIAEAGKTIEGLCGSPQDIEGLVKDGIIHVVQARPQI